MLGHVDIRVVQQSSSVDGWEALCQKAGLAQVSVGGSLAEERVGAAQHTSSTALRGEAAGQQNAGSVSKHTSTIHC